MWVLLEVHSDTRVWNGFPALPSGSDFGHAAVDDQLNASDVATFVGAAVD
jgi:hypothetical protein